MVLLFKDVLTKNELCSDAFPNKLVYDGGVRQFYSETVNLEAIKMDVGDSTTVRDVTFTFKGVSEVQGPNYVAARGSIEVSRDGRVLREMNPEKRMYRVQTNPMTEAAIATGLTGDLYVSLGEPVEGSNGAWIVRVYVKPFVDWIWGGCLLIAFGGLLAASDRRYRAKVKSEQTVSAAVGAGA